MKPWATWTAEVTPQQRLPPHTRQTSVVKGWRSCGQARTPWSSPPQEPCRCQSVCGTPTCRRRDVSRGQLRVCGKRAKSSSGGRCCRGVCDLRARDFLGGFRTSPTVGFEATSSGPWMSVLGWVPPTAAVGYDVAQLGGQLSGDEIAHPTGTGRPIPDIDLLNRVAEERPHNRSGQPPNSWIYRLWET